MVTIKTVLSGSIAEALELRVGSRIVRINGDIVRDGIDFRFLEAEPWLEVEVADPAGERVILEIEKDPAELLGIEPAPDPVRECANKCVFCFIDGNPEGVRQSLYLRDDDFRLSFAYGSYVTLTNLGAQGIARLIEQRLSPLYVSVHATEPWVRERILGVGRGGDVLERLGELVRGGIAVHAQIVLCPGWNDGPHLRRSIDDLWRLGEGIQTLSVVPVGLTRHNAHRPVRPLSPEEARDAIAAVERARGQALGARGYGWAYAADELFYLAGETLPGADYHDDDSLAENGVGALSDLLADFGAALADGAFHGNRVAVLTGTRVGAELRHAVAELAGGGGPRILPVPNRLFGSEVSAAGLMAGRDALAALAACGPFDLILVPATALNGDGVFIDDIPGSAIEGAARGARVVFAESFSEALAA
ncbi:MAG: DUF512 domain-containing protein [Gemmatimonadota bacterium]